MPCGVQTFKSGVLPLSDTPPYELSTLRFVPKILWHVLILDQDNCSAKLSWQSFTAFYLIKCRKILGVFNYVILNTGANATENDTWQRPIVDPKVEPLVNVKI